jgi:hypothetical protein
MALVRRLNDRGLTQFRAFLQTIRAGAEFQPNPAILYVDDFSAPLSRPIRIEARRFRNKYDAAAYLTDVLAPIDAPGLGDDAGLWSWLALFYFEQLSPRGADGKRRPREDYHYVLGSTSRDAQRHLLAGPFKIYGMHREKARLLLYPPVNQHGSFIWDLGSRRDLITNRGLVEAIDRLYWDRRTSRPRRGATTVTRAGNLRRLTAVVQQLDFNYDLYGMTADEILGLLPPEFDGWREAGNRKAESRKQK